MDSCLPDMGVPSEQVKHAEVPGQSFLEALANVPLEAVASKPEKRLPKGPGEKSRRLEGTAEETQKLHDYLSEQLSAQSAVRISSRKALSTASWDAEIGLATVTVQKGSHWSTHGHTHSGQLMLEAHEALFLMEMGCLELVVGGLPMTLQQVVTAYHTLLGDNLPLHHYTFIILRGILTAPQTTHTVTQATPTTVAGVEVLRVLPSCSLCHPSPHPLPAQCLLEVYQPRGPYRKSSPGPPAFRVCVVSPRDLFPSPSLLKQLSAMDPPAPLRCCVADGSCLTYYTITQGTVPVL